jgi:hypothetical protein
MTTCNDIIRLAMGQLRQLRAGEQPTGQEALDGMIAMQAMFDSWTAQGLFGRVNDTIPTSDYTACEQDRVINDGGYTITLPTTITPILPTGTYYPIWPDERTWTALQSATQRPPRDRARIEIVASGTTKRYLYDARTRAWVRIDGLALTDTAPLANRGALGLSACLAGLIADSYGEQVSPSTARQAALFMWGLSARYDGQRVDGMQDYF